uniref:Uncharacterized protein n=1 Tax=Anopheles merus TaxID=30066 RepID=A0A182VIS6_ANOME
MGINHQPTTPISVLRSQFFYPNRKMSDIADTGSPTLPSRHNLFANSNGGPLAASTTSGSLGNATSTSSMTTSQEVSDTFT